MPSKATKKTRRKRSAKVKRPEYWRRSYMLDQATLEDTGVIQQALRASTASEAIRYAIRKMASLMRYTEKGYVIQVIPPASEKGAIPLLVDIPAAKGT